MMKTFTHSLAALAALFFLSASSFAQVPDFYDPDTIRDIKLKFTQSNWWQLLLNNKSAKINISADMTVDGKTYKNVGVRFRGQTSYSWLPPNSEKKSFNISTDAFVSGQDIYGYDNLNLNNGFHDPSFMREFVTYMICRRYGPAPKCNFVRLWLNGVYWGIYVNAQQPNKDMLKEWFRSNDGNRYRGFPSVGSFRNGRTALTWLGSNVQSYKDAYEVKQGDAIDLMQLCNVLNNTPTNQIQSTLPKIFSVDQFYRYAACMNIMLQTDSYIGSGKDHFLYHDDFHGDFQIFPFDVNESFGAEGGGDPKLSPWFNTTLSTRPAFSKTMQFNDWKARYDAHYRTILEGSFSWTELGGIITKYHKMISADVAKDTKKIYSTKDFNDNLTKDVWGPGGFRGRNVWIKGLQPLITAREIYLKSLAAFKATRVALSKLQHSPQNPNAKDTVCITVKADSNAAQVTLFSRKVGPFGSTPMYDDGKHCDGPANDGVFGVTLAATAAGTIVDYYVEATTTAGVASYLPKTAEHLANYYRIDWPRGSSPIVINEFVAQNVNGIVDEKNQHEDWLELHNTSTQSVAVGGMYVTDNLSISTKWRIPTNTTIPGSGTLLIWCDEDGNQGPMHANFKLSSRGEEIALFAKDGQTMLDVIEFGAQRVDIATGRLVDGGKTWVTLLDPSPRTLNVIAGCGTRRFSALVSGAHALAFAMSGSPKIGTSPLLTIANGPSSGVALLYLAAGGTHLELGIAKLVLLIDPFTLTGGIGLPLDAQGKFSGPLAIPNDQRFVGLQLDLQLFGVGTTGLSASNALELVFCK